MKNMLLQEIRYKVDETGFGTWRRFVYPDGHLFEEFVSHQRFLGLPLLHYTRGKCPETGKRIIATGIVALGRLAFGVVAIGHASAGLVAIGQLGLGMLLGLGQATTGIVALGQLAVGLGFGFGQFATGFVAIGQIGFGSYVLAQAGYGANVWDMRGGSEVAKAFFRAWRP